MGRRGILGGALLIALLASSVVGCSNEAAPGGGPVGNNSPVNNSPVNNSAPTCTPTGEEACDSVDNDCDGMTDEGWSLRSDLENCGGCGVVCAFERGLAACMGGECALVGCEPGAFDADGDPSTGCEADACTPTGAEACDGLDNDCDGVMDEGFQVGQGEANCLGCGQPCALPNASSSCDAGACLLVACAPGWEDVNGAPEDGCEVGRCPGGAQPVQEVCDGADNDCDGQVDEDFDLTTPAQCGSCGNACAIAGAVPACVEGACAVERCDQGRYDLNGAVEDGCEYACLPRRPSAAELPCDGEDNNCDGQTDEGFEEGAACGIGEQLTGASACAGEALRCVAPPSGGAGASLCGALEGVLTAEGGPYTVTCAEVEIPEGAVLEVEPGAVLVAPGGATLRVRGSLVSAQATWRGVSVVVDGGEAAWSGDALEATGAGQALVTLRGGGRLEASQVTAAGAGHAGVRGLVLEPGGQGEALVWSGGAFTELAIGVEQRDALPPRFESVIWTQNERGILLGAGSGGVEVMSGAFNATAGAPRVAVEAEAGQGDAQPSILLSGSVFAMRSEDAALRLDPDDLDALGLTGLVVAGSAPPIALRGDVDGAASVAPQGALTRFVVEGPMQVLAGASLTVGAELRGREEASLTVSGELVAAGARIEDVSLRVEGGGVAGLGGGRWSWSSAGQTRGCLVEVVEDGALDLTSGRLQGRENLGDGLCVTGGDAALTLTGASLFDFDRGVVVTDGRGLTLSGANLTDHHVAVEVLGDGAPTVTGLRIISSASVDSVGVRCQVGANPGGAFTDNTFNLDAGDVAWHLDPDNFALGAGETAFAPNAWQGVVFTGYDLSGEQTSAVISLRDITAQGAANPAFIVRLVDDVTVGVGSSFRARFSGEQALILQGVQPAAQRATLRVLGAASLQGPALTLRDAPVLFEAGSSGDVSGVRLESIRNDLPILRITDAAPRIGGSLAGQENTLVGGNLRNVTGVELRASAPMCDGGASLCPFIARNTLRELAIGFLIYDPADFNGANTFESVTTPEEHR